jgi:peroxiredoxin
MKYKYWIALFVAGLLSCGQGLFAAETNDTTIADLTNLVARINAKLDAGKMHETDFADNLKEFDALAAKHKDDQPEELVQILLVKAQLYSDVFREPKNALAVYKQIKHDFPTVQFNVDIDGVISGLEETVKQWEIWNALAVGTKFPDFTATDVTGKPLSLAEYTGKVVLIDFWATWCPPCRAELPNILKTYQQYHNRGFEVIGVSLDDNQQKLLAFTTNMNMPWPQSCDGQGWTGKLAVKYGVYQLPGTCLLDGKGKIIGKDLRGEELEQAVAKALPKK